MIAHISALIITTILEVSAGNLKPVIVRDFPDDVPAFILGDYFCTEHLDPDYLICERIEYMEWGP